MISHATPDFWACFNELPERVQATAKAAYPLWLTNPQHPSLHFKPVPSAGEGVWSVRIGIHWRALGTRDGLEEFVHGMASSHTKHAGPSIHRLAQPAPGR